MKRQLLIPGIGLLAIALAGAYLLWSLPGNVTSSASTAADYQRARVKLYGTNQTVAVDLTPLDLNKPVRLAIGSLGLANESENRELGDLVSARLNKTPGLNLVERRELDQVLGEMAVNLSGLVRASAAVRVGEILGADWFLLGSSTWVGGTNFIIARIVDAKSGVMQDLAMLPNTGSPLSLADALGDFARRVRKSMAQPVLREFLAIGQFGNEGVNNRQQDFPAQLRSYLMRAYQGSKITVLEREYMDALLQEMRLDLAGLTENAATNPVRTLQSAFWVVEGTFQSQESNGLEIEVALRANRVFDLSTEHSFRGKPGNALFGQIKAFTDSLLNNPNREVLPSRITEARIQMETGRELYSLATGNRKMDRFIPWVLADASGPSGSDLRQRNLEEAIRAFQTAILLRPEDLEARFDLASCYFDRSVGRAEEARNLLEEIASSTDYDWSQTALLALGYSYVRWDHAQSARWFEAAARHAQNDRDAGFARKLAAEGAVEAIGEHARAGAAPGTQERALLVRQLESRLRESESVLQGKGGVIDSWYGLHQFVEAFGPDRRVGAEQLVELLPSLRTNFPAMVPHILAATVAVLPNTNSPIFPEFLDSLEASRNNPTDLLGADYYFQSLLTVDYQWCCRQGLFGLAGKLVRDKQAAANIVPALKLSAEDNAKLAFACACSLDFSNALRIFEAMGETPVKMMSEGPWGRTFSIVLPTSKAAFCREKLGLPVVADGRRFTFGPSCLCYGSDAVFAGEPDGLWFGTGHRLLHLTPDLQTNLSISLPGGSFSPVTALCLEGGKVWIGTGGDGLLVYDKTTGQSRQFTAKDGLLMDAIRSLCFANGRLWIGYGKLSGEGLIGGLGRLDLASGKFTALTPGLPAHAFAEPSAGLDQPPRNSVNLIVAGPNDQFLVDVAQQGARLYDAEKNKWSQITFGEQTASGCFVGTPEQFVLGLQVQRFNLSIRDHPASQTTDPPSTILTNLTAAEMTQARELYRSQKKIVQTEVVWQSALGISGAGEDHREIVARDGSIPARSQTMILHGPNLFIAGQGYVAVFDLNQKRVVKLARIATENVEGLQVAAGYVWVEFEHHVYRAPLSTVLDSAQTSSL